VQNYHKSPQKRFVIIVVTLLTIRKVKVTTQLIANKSSTGSKQVVYFSLSSIR